MQEISTLSNTQLTSYHQDTDITLGRFLEEGEEVEELFEEAVIGAE